MLTKLLVSASTQVETTPTPPNSGQTREQVLSAYPYLEDEDISAALAFGAARVNERDVPLAQTA
ncbi:MAG: DUF433 domain-containing protein [Acidimicrobiales bacterium]